MKNGFPKSVTYGIPANKTFEIDVRQDRARPYVIIHDHETGETFELSKQANRELYNALRRADLLM